MKKYSKTLKIMAVLMVLMLAVTACNKKPEGVIATVNGVEIKDEDFAKKYDAAKKALIASYGEEILKEASPQDASVTMEEVLKKNVLDNMIQVEIIKQDAEKNDIKVDEAKVNEQIAQAVTVYGGEENYKKALAEQGIDEEYFKNYLSESMLIQQYTEKKMSELTPSDEEVKAYFDKNQDKFTEVDASHILVETEEEAKEIKKQLEEGADFATLAKEKSTDTGTKDNGGNLGFFKKGDMVEEFEKAAFALEKGKLSDPVKTQFGYHIIKLNDTKSDFESSKDLVKSTMTNEKLKEFLQKLEKEAKIKKYLDPKAEVTPAGEAKPETENKPAENAAETNAKSNNAKDNSTDNAKENNAKN